MAPGRLPSTTTPNSTGWNNAVRADRYPHYSREACPVQLKSLHSRDYGQQGVRQIAVPRPIKPFDQANISYAEAPKSLPPAAKQRLVLDYLRKSRTCHTLRDLEKTLPPIASISGMQVKDYINALHDENCIHVEKIGSGNWYWAWANEERNELMKLRDTLKGDLARIEASINECEAARVALATELGVDIGPKEEKERKELFIQEAVLGTEIAALKAEENGRLSGSVGGGTRHKEEDIRRWKTEAEMWTDNVYILEEYLKKLAGGDRETMDSVKRDCYGTDFIEGEGLRELTF
ncbi:hypothetical protein KEM54_002088 [Ascosphaera aggregata]|nr:hypothetical protein KEM54_002088 [Ascosphaera aggregata]